MQYNWQQRDWPDFRYDTTPIERLLYAFAEETGLASGLLKAMPENMQMEAILDIMVAEAIKTSEIEGEYLSRQDVVSYIRNNLGISKTTLTVKDQKAKGAAQLMTDVRNSFAEPLTEETLLAWHKTLMVQNSHITPGAWRTHDAPMQVISGGFGKEKIHFEAPPSHRVPSEIIAFIKWFNDTAVGGKKEIRYAPVRAAIAHLYFESIHPFEDGNGRIGRAIAEKALSQTIGRPVLLSLSNTIEANKSLYYTALETAQRSNEISGWISYFVETTLTAQKQAKDLVDFILLKAKFFDQYKDMLNERQRKAINKMMDAGPDGFEGGMNAKKYISITKASKATATRDLQQLTEIGALLMQGGGRSIHYKLNIATA